MMFEKVIARILPPVVKFFRIIGVLLGLLMIAFFHCLFYVLIAACFVLTYLGISSYWNKTEVKAYQNSEQVENEVKTLNPYQRCIALGGVPDECKVFMRGLDKAPESK